MKKTFLAVLLLISGSFVITQGSAFTFYAGNDYYLTKDLIDTTAKEHNLFVNFGLGLDDIVGSGVSFHSDFLATNTTYDALTGATMRKTFEVATCYLDWRSEAGGANVRLGRQRFNNLVYDRYDLDAARLTFRPHTKAKINALFGLTVPTPYAGRTLVQATDYAGSLLDSFSVEYKHFLLSDFDKSKVALVDGSFAPLPFTIMNASFGIVPAPYMRSRVGYDTISQVDPLSGAVTDSVVKSEKEPGKDDIRGALGVAITPPGFIRFNGSARFSKVHNGFDRIDGRITVIPSDMTELTGYYLSSRSQFDSTNYLSYMFLDQLQELGASANFFPDKNTCIHVDYHFNSAANEGADHFFTFNATNNRLFGGITLSTGYNGTVIHPFASVRLPFWKVVTLEGAADFYRVFRTRHFETPWDSTTITEPVITTDPATGDTLSITPYEPGVIKKAQSPYNIVYLTGGLKIEIPRIGLSIHPQAQYIVNRYYKQDVRFLLTTKLLIYNYWRGRV